MAYLRSSSFNLSTASVQQGPVKTVHVITSKTSHSQKAKGRAQMMTEKTDYTAVPTRTAQSPTARKSVIIQENQEMEETWDDEVDSTGEGEDQYQRVNSPLSGRMLQHLYLEQKAKECMQRATEESGNTAATARQDSADLLTAHSPTAQQSVFSQKKQDVEETWDNDCDSTDEQDQYQRNKPKPFLGGVNSPLSGRMLQCLYLEQKAKERAQAAASQNTSTSTEVQYSTVRQSTTLEGNTYTRNQQVEETWNGEFDPFSTGLKRNCRHGDFYQPTDRAQKSRHSTKYPVHNGKMSNIKQAISTHDKQPEENWDDEVEPSQTGFKLNTKIGQLNVYLVTDEDERSGEQLEEDWVAECEEFPDGFKGNYAHNKLKLFQSTDKKESTEEKWYCGIPGLVKPSEQKQGQGFSKKKKGSSGKDHEAPKVPSEHGATAGNTSCQDKPQKQQQQWVKVGRQGKAVKKPQKKGKC